MSTVTSPFSQLDHAGLTHLPDGSLRRGPFAYDDENEPIPYRLWLDGDLLRGEWQPVPHNPDMIYLNLSRTTGLLNAFIRIRKAEHIVQFAERYGVLGFCPEHRLLLHGCGSGGNDVFEPIVGWLQHAAAARSVMQVSAAVYLGNTGQREDLERVLEFSTGLTHAGLVRSIRRRKDVASAAACVAEAIQHWWKVGGVRLDLHWRDTVETVKDFEPQVTVTAGTFGLAGAQLLFAVLRRDAVFFCSGCGSAYLREGRMPQRGRRNYCQQCARNPALQARQRKQAWRQRKQEEAEAAKRRGGKG